MGSAAPQSCSDSPLLPRLAAWLAVLLVHLLMLWWLLHAGRIALIAHDNSRISLRWLPPEAPPMSPQVVDASRPSAAPHQVRHAPRFLLRRPSSAQRMSIGNAARLRATNH
ncbi:hypothetical protein X548_05405 [Stenotrophomonas maltophilia 5BA-I-2]|nr:hypothetical protein X548_05405 [Stenotrophomonas maltophilia 5BA-I-2]